MCALELEVVVVGCGTEVQLQFGYELQTSDPHTHTHTRWFVKVYGGNAVVTPGNALSANLPNVFSLPIISSLSRGGK